MGKPPDLNRTCDFPMPATRTGNRWAYFNFKELIVLGWSELGHSAGERQWVHCWCRTRRIREPRTPLPTQARGNRSHLLPSLASWDPLPSVKAILFSPATPSLWVTQPRMISVSQVGRALKSIPLITRALPGFVFCSFTFHHAVRDLLGKVSLHLLTWPRMKRSSYVWTNDFKSSFT